MSFDATTVKVPVMDKEGAKWVPAFAAAFLGLIILAGVAFAPLSVAHNAAHDTRHTAAFPCH